MSECVDIGSEASHSLLTWPTTGLSAFDSNLSTPVLKVIINKQPRVIEGLVSLSHNSGYKYEIFQWKNKDHIIYEGNFKNDVLDGEGKITYENGKVDEGTFENGILVKRK